MQHQRKMYCQMIKLNTQIMKRYFFSIALMLGMALSIMATLSSCEKEGDTPGKPSTNCTLTGTIENVMCGTGAYGGLWIKGDDGKFYQPCESSVSVNGFVEGARVKFGYKVIKGQGQCDLQPRCLIATPEAVKMNLTCAQIISSPPNKECGLTGTVFDGKILSSAQCDAMLIQTADGKLLEPVNQDKLANLSHGTKVYYSYVPAYTFSATCSGATPVELTCLRWNWCGTGNFCKPLTMASGVQPNGVSILNAAIDGNCLRLKVGFGGCNDHSDVLQLVWDGTCMKSLPAQVNLVVYDPQPQLCEAYFVKEVSYDLSKLKESIAGPMIIRLAGMEKGIEY